jgi:hypothetical protein
MRTRAYLYEDPKRLCCSWTLFFSPNKTKDLGLLKMGMIMMRKQRGEEI